MSALFTPDYKAFTDLLGNQINYVIPTYQRPYSWDCLGRSDKNNQVNVMWDDLIEYFESGNTEPYFMGSMVMISTADREFEVIDGQQRLTSILLLFASIKCVMRDQTIRIEPSEGRTLEQYKAYFSEIIDEIERLIFNRNLRPGNFLPEKKVKIQRGIGFDFDSVLDAVMNCKNRTPDNFNRLPVAGQRHGNLGNLHSQAPRKGINLLQKGNFFRKAYGLNRILR